MDMKKVLVDRKQIKDVTVKDDGEEVSIAGWLYDKRELGKLIFLVVRDITGEIQITGFKGETDEKVFANMKGINRESVIVVKGKVKKSAKATGGREINPDFVEVISKAEETLPIDTTDFSKTELPKRLDYRFLDFHRRKTQAIFKIQSFLARSFINHFAEKGFIVMQPPSVLGASSEGGADLFEVKYFEKKALLAQSPQLYKQMMACSMEKVAMISPAWRAEKHNTVRHINEMRQMDIEAAFYDMFGIMKLEEEVIQYLVKTLIEECADELKLLDVQLKVPKAHYISYDDTIKLLNKNKVKISYGDDLSPEAEKKLGELYSDDLVFVHSWPLSLRSFYLMPRNEDPKAELSEGFDCIYKGLEITSGGQRIHLPELLTNRIKAKGIDPKTMKDYIDSFRYGAPFHSGWSIGLERLTMLVCGLDNIREATLFPRDRDRLTP
ncbi:MAG: aspartate--tRNA(Asn) ligase [Nanoarchaeota archaeon]